MASLQCGDRATVDGIVTGHRIASVLAAEEGERYPEVFGTPFLIAELERACAKLLLPMLKPGQLSVGARIEVSHLAPTGLGGRYTATATYVRQESGLYWFEVVAEDAAGVIAKGIIARAIVVEADILS